MAELFRLVQVPFDAKTARDVVGELGVLPGARFVGTPEALEALGIENGALATEEAVAAVLDFRSAGADAERVVESQRPDGPGIEPTHTVFEFVGPKHAQEQYRSYKGQPEEQDRLKSDLLAIAEDTLARVTSSYGLDSSLGPSDGPPYETGDGYVAIATTDQVTYRGSNRDPASAQGIIVAVDRGGGWLAAADGNRLVSEQAQQLAKDVAAAGIEERGLNQGVALQPQQGVQRGAALGADVGGGYGY